MKIQLKWAGSEVGKTVTGVRTYTVHRVHVADLGMLEKLEETSELVHVNAANVPCFALEAMVTAEGKEEPRRFVVDGEILVKNNEGAVVDSAALGEEPSEEPVEEPVEPEDDDDSEDEE